MTQWLGIFVFNFCCKFCSNSARSLLQQINADQALISHWYFLANWFNAITTIISRKFSEFVKGSNVGRAAGITGNILDPGGPEGMVANTAPLALSTLRMALIRVARRNDMPKDGFFGGKVNHGMWSIGNLDHKCVGMCACNWPSRVFLIALFTHF